MGMFILAPGSPLQIDYPMAYPLSTCMSYTLHVSHNTLSLSHNSLSLSLSLSSLFLWVKQTCYWALIQK